MKKPALMAAVAAVSILAAVNARAATDDVAAAGASNDQQQTEASTAPVKLKVSAAPVIPDSKDLRGQVTAHRTDNGDIGFSDEDEDKDEK